MQLHLRLLGLAAAVLVVGGCASWHQDDMNLSYRSSAVPIATEASPATLAVAARVAETTADQTTTDQTTADQSSAHGRAAVYRSQSVEAATWSGDDWDNSTTPGTDDTYRRPMAVSGIPANGALNNEGLNNGATIRPTQFTNPSDTSRAGAYWGNSPPPQASQPLAGGDRSPAPNAAAGNRATANPWQDPLPRVAQVPGSSFDTVPPNAPVAPTAPSGVLPPPSSAVLPPISDVEVPPSPITGLPTPYADIFVNVQETQTGSLMVGAAVNSDAGLTGQIVIDEKNFDWRRVPTSWDDVVSGRAFRGAGQGFRLEAMPGDQVQRYMFNFSEPYLGGTRISFNLSGYLFDRRYVDWDEQHLGGRIGLGYRITPDLSFSTSLRGEEVTISDPRILGVPELDEALGSHDLYSTRFTLTQDTRDIPFAPTQGYFLELTYEQTFGSFDYPRGSIDYRRYFLIAERPDGSGRHVLGFSNRVLLTGSNTPVFENFFAGGYSTLRGFDFRGASPQNGGVIVGGEFSLLGSVEYLFPITADDMLKGVVFVDYGTVEEEIQIEGGDYRVALGAGLRISIPAMGPAPIALDFAVPVAREDTDDIRNFSFFVGVSR